MSIFQALIQITLGLLLIPDLQTDLAQMVKPFRIQRTQFWARSRYWRASSRRPPLSISPAIFW